jgi:hypothetical protein
LLLLLLLLLLAAGAGAGGGGALLHPPKSSSGVMDGCDLDPEAKLDEPHGSLDIDGVLVAGTALLDVSLDSGVLHTSEEPQPSNPDPELEKPLDVGLAAVVGCARFERLKAEFRLGESVEGLAGASGAGDDRSNRSEVAPTAAGLA